MMTILLKSAFIVGLTAVAVDYAYPYVPYRVPREKKRYSKVITEVEGWENEGYLIPHEPIRRDMAVLDRVNKLWEDGTLDDEKKEVFLKWFEVFGTQVSLHAKSEDVFFFSFFESKGAVLGTLSNDHEKLEELLAMRGDAVLDNLSELTSLLVSHFDEEERAFRPLFGTAITHSEWKVAVSESHKAYTMDQKTLVLPHIMHSIAAWSSPVRQEEMDLQFPWFLRHFLHRFWLPTYYSQHMDPIAVLMAE
eukprot:TRINITY_DN1359_c0_g1_i3.p1 TRINITY_DN1359_c0_g1~~TRINITY_DN1359_c0_g1_i3.p1  ORF type:complete len:249 (+),score=50.15 TRINITY_DN1359_c0_g1_i3:75-821(+)